MGSTVLTGNQSLSLGQFSHMTNKSSTAVQVHNVIQVVKN